jgi:hypothetical protein
VLKLVPLFFVFAAVFVLIVAVAFTFRFFNRFSVGVLADGCFRTDPDFDYRSRAGEGASIAASSTRSCIT